MTTTTTTDAKSQQKRPSPRGAVSVALVALALLVAGCTNSGDSTETTTTDGSSATAPAVATTSPPPVEINAADLLSGALARYGDGYQFTAKADIGNSDSVHVVGVIIGTSAQSDITTGDGTVRHVVTPEGAWAKAEDGLWKAVSGGGAIDSPLDSLASPISIEVVSVTGDIVTAAAVYEGAAFSSEEPVNFNLIFNDGLLVSASYSTDGASVQTLFSSLGEATIDDPTAEGA